MLGRFVLFLLLPATPLSAAPYADLFLDKTMRVDYFHTGGRGEEIVALDRVVSDGPWPGSRTQLVDTSNLGKYLFEVIDRSTNQVIYSRGFASVFGEWETTGEARTRHRTLHESLRFPWPKAPVQVVLKKRDAQNAFQQIWSTNIDPSSRFVNPADIA
ncbi:MAG TPA: peptidase M64 N-terminal domain-containing protein, partial [Thermoanaerobaculia bacterium]|nr:peptidase M64 N-terminal domain-containing protein [Thermoanaerobaculia bacterium]